ncbi:hypothetical protein [Heyndrickxia sporothermodurans]|uniref:Uncharacterized protein n=1 Tax=Heyndrickxia sporothermodurans TaxID=46224 RepID=A0A150KKG8_9BACI|nr:hypothetical protein [Heyndrickxia sporothermodurans]KYC89938.1 hypothetical protein B4102_3945 [Heyndrickxia sporothermodurans]
MAPVFRFLSRDQALRKEVLPMTNFKALVLMISFVTLVVMIMKEK